MVVVMKEIRLEKAKQIFDKQGPIVKAAVLRENKYCSKDILELVSGGYLTKIKSGYYVWSTTTPGISDMEIAASVMKNGVICLFTAAQYYELTTVNPAAIDIAVPLVGKKPLLPEYPPINLYTVKKSIFDIGIAEIKIDTGSLKMYDKERTICDFFRMRLQIGEDVALEVLKNYMAQNGKNLQKLFEYASRLRIKSIIKPYVEALL